MNKTIEMFARRYIKDILSQYTSRQQDKFKRMYDFKNEYPELDQLVDNMSSEKLDWAMSQCERTVENNKKGKEED
jgi:hypothetical protein